MHQLLCDKFFSDEYRNNDPDTHYIGQALHCPYYTTVTGSLGLDWGIVLNPESLKFGQLVFEHDKCGCPVDEDGWPLHGNGKQIADEWLVPGERKRLQELGAYREDK